MYAVVQFVDDQAVAVVHKNWFVDETTVHWPGTAKSELIRRLLKMQACLAENTPVYKIKKLGEAGKYII